MPRGRSRGGLGMAAVAAMVACLLAGPATAHAFGPRAVITDGPTGQVSSRAATFEFVSTSSAPFARFECRLDSGRWTRCSSPASYQGLVGGPHLFEVRLNGAFADATPDKREWVVTRPSEMLPCGSAPCRPLEVPPSQNGPPTSDTVAPRRKDVRRCGYAGNRVGEFSNAKLRRATLCLLNRERRARGLRRLRRNWQLERAAQRHARDMVSRHYFAHVSRNGRTAVDRIRAAGYLRGAPSWVVGEVLAYGGPSRATPTATVEAWMHSAPHRRLILSPSFRDAGVGVVPGAARDQRPGSGTFAAELGRRG